MRIISALLTFMLFVGSAFADAYSGMRVYDGGGVYVINPEGEKQLIPYPDTYDRLFRTWYGITPMDTRRFPVGLNISTDAKLIKGAAPDVYLWSSFMKRPITEEAFNRFQFDWRQIVTVSEATLASIPTGPLWQ